MLANIEVRAFRKHLMTSQFAEFTHVGVSESDGKDDMYPAVCLEERSYGARLKASFYQRAKIEHMLKTWGTY